MKKTYRIDIDKWKQNGLFREWGPLWPTEDCPESELWHLRNINRDLRCLDTAEELDQYADGRSDLVRRICQEYRRVIYPVWTELANPAQLQQPDYRFRVWCDPWKDAFLQVRFAETERAEQAQETGCLRPLWPAETILAYWIRYSFDTMQPLENGFTWRHSMKKAAVRNDLVYFYCGTIDFGARVCAVPLNIINEILSHFSGAQTEHRRQRKNLLTQRNWNYSIFAYRDHFGRANYGVCFEDSLESHSWPIFWESSDGTAYSVDSLSYYLWDFAMNNPGTLTDPDQHGICRIGYSEIVRLRDGWVEWSEYYDGEDDYDTGWFFQGCLPYSVFRDILLDMQRIADSNPPIPQKDERPTLFTRTYAFRPGTSG